MKQRRNESVAWYAPLKRGVPFCVLVLFPFLCAGAEVPRPEEATIWIVAEPVNNAAQLDMALSVKPDVILRGWFKWWTAPNVTPMAPLAQQAAEKGSIFGGGVTCSALQRNENGITDEQFQRFVDRDATGAPAWFYNRPDSGCYHGDIANKEYLDYVVKWACRQIDAGATTLFMDEVNGAATEYNGYSDAGCAAFRGYLIERYVKGKGWSLDDPRWKEQFRIDLTNREVCPDGTMTSFQHRAYLKQIGGTQRPLIPESNPLAREWGPPGAIEGDTYCAKRNRDAWQTMVETIRRYAAEHDRKVYLAANGLNLFVDYQIEPIWLKTVDFTKSNVGRYRASIDWSRRLLGRDVPLVLFHDWGFEIPWEKLSAEDRVLWLRVGAPEIFAAGAFFAWPVSGCGGKTRADQNGTLDTIRKLTAWYRANAAIYHGVRWLGADVTQVPGTELPGVTTTLLEQSAAKRRYLHVINRKIADHKPTPRSALRLVLPTAKKPLKAWAVSPDFADAMPVAISHEGSTLTLTLDRLDAYAVIVMEYDQLPGGDEQLLLRPVMLDTDVSWGQTGGTEFTVDGRGLHDANGKISAFLHGSFHAEMQVKQTFHVDCGDDAKLTLKVNSVAKLGARLNVHIDDKVALDENLPDTDGKNDVGAHEYHRVFTVKLPAGKHNVILENAGVDWVTIDQLVFEGLK